MTNQNHAKHKSMKLESINENTLYAVTLSPPDTRDINTAKCNSVRIKVNFKEHLEAHIKLFDKLEYCELTLYPELSPVGRLHYHGYIKIKDKFKFYWRDLYLLTKWMMYEMDTLTEDHDETYLPYCKKQERTIKPVVEDILGEGTYPIHN